MSYNSPFKLKPLSEKQIISMPNNQIHQITEVLSVIDYFLPWRKVKKLEKLQKNHIFHSFVRHYGKFEKFWNFFKVKLLYYNMYMNNHFLQKEVRDKSLDSIALKDNYLWPLEFSIFIIFRSHRQQTPPKSGRHTLNATFSEHVS